MFINISHCVARKCLFFICHHPKIVLLLYELKNVKILVIFETLQIYKSSEFGMFAKE